MRKLAALFILMFMGSAAFGQAPTITNATWSDQNNDGNIDRVVLTFSIPVNINDPSGAADGFDAIAISDGGAVTLDNQDVNNVSGSATSLTLNFTGANQISGTSIAGLSATYATGGTTSIENPTGPTEMVNGTTPGLDIDGAAPIVLSATTVDVGGDGVVEGMQVQFSEAMVDLEFTAAALADWTLDDGGGAVSFDGFSTTVGSDTDANDDLVTLTISSGISGTDAMSYAYTNDGGGADDLTDGSTNVLANITTTGATDGAVLVVLQALTIDAGGDGTVEAMELQFSEPISDADFTAGAIADWTLNDGSGPASFDGFSTAVTDITTANVADDEYITLTISSGVAGTGVMNYAYANDNPPTDNIEDFDTNEVLADIGATAATDGATPIVLSATTVDVGGDGVVEGMQVQFSEAMVDLEFTAAALADWTLDDGGGAVSFDGFSTTVGSDTDANDDLVTLTISSGISGTDAMSYAYTNDGGGADDLTDGSTNVLANITTTGATDGAVLVVLQALTIDAGGDGTVEAMELQFSEPISDADFTAGAIADWTLNDGSGPASFDGFSTAVTDITTANVADDEYITLTISSGVAGTGVMNYAYANDNPPTDNIEDFDTNEVLADIGATAATDGATPIVLSATTVDVGGDGVVEGMQVQFSEAMVDLEFTAAALADWTLDDGGGAVSFDGFSTTVGSDTDANDDLVTLTISSGISGTDAMSYAYTNDGGGADDLTDGSTNVLANITTTGATDGAVLVVLQALTIDAGGDGTVEAMELQFSEPISDADFTAGAIADWTLNDGSGPASFDGFSTAVTDITTANVADDEYITLTISSGVAGTGVMNYAYANDNPPTDNIEDFDTNEVLADIGATAATDGATPIVLSATTVDVGGDGVVEGMQVQFSEAMVDLEFTAAALADWTLDDGGGAVSFDGFSTTVGSDTDANDDLVTLTISSGISGTDAMSYAYTNDGGGADDLTDGSTNVLANITTTGATDGAVLVVLQALSIDAGGDGTVEAMELQFSEPISDADFTAGAIADWTLNDGSGPASFDGFSTAVTDITTANVADDEYITLTISSGVAGTGVMNYAYANDNPPTDNIEDFDTNEVLADIGATAATDGATPIVLSATTVDVGGDGVVEGMQVQFSEAMVDLEFTAAALADWTLDDGGGAVSFDGFSTTVGSDTDANDDLVTLTISSGISGTDAMSYAYTNDGGGADDLTDGSTNVLANITTTGATDGAVLVVLQALTIDAGGDGTVEAMELQFSEPISDADFTAGAIADWTLNDGSGPASFDGFSTAVTDITTANVADDEYITLTISSGVAGTGVMNYAYANDNPPTDNIEDFDTNEVLADIGATAATDGATPIVLSATTVDVGGDGVVEGMQVQFSEAMVDLEFTAAALADWTLDDGGGAVSFDGFSTTVGSDTDANDDLVTLTISSGISGTDAMSYAYTNDGGGADDLTDGSTNVLANITTTGATDGAVLVVLQALTIDAGGDGTVEAMELQFSEPISDADFTAGAIADWTLNDGSGPASFDGFSTAVTDITTANVADDEYITLTISSGVAGTGVMNYAYANDNPPTDNIEDFDTNEVLADIGATAATDGAAPAIASANVDATNSFVSVVFSEEVNDNGDGDITTADFDITINDGGAGVSVSDIVNQEDPALSLVAVNLPEDTLIFTLSAADLSAVGSTENIEIAIKTAGNTIVDGASNQPDVVTPESTGVLPFNDISFNVTILSMTPAPDNSYIEIVFSEPVARNNAEDRNIRLVDTEDNGDIRPGQWDNGSNLLVASGVSFVNNEDELFSTYNDNGSGLTIEDDSGGDIFLADNLGSKLTSSSGYIGDTFRFTLNPNGSSIPTFTGSETYTFSKRNENLSTAAIIRGVNTDGFMSNTYSATVNFRDLFQNDFANATATAFDVDNDGHIDEIVVKMPDDIDDATLSASEFTFNGEVATSIVTSPLNGVDDLTANDSTFTLGFTTVIGTSVSTNSLVYTAGTLRDDGALPYADDADGNLFIGGSITPADAAAPVIANAVTEDNDLNGQIDRLVITFSEPIQSSSLDVTGATSADFDDFDDDAIYDILAVTDGTPDDAEVTLTISESGSPDTYVTPDITLVASQITDAEPNSIASNQVFTNTSDGAAPYITVNTASGNATPDFSGTVDDINATLIISVDGQTRSTAPAIQNNGNGTWDYTSASDGSPITLSSGLGTYEVTVIGIDNSGNNRTDVTSNEYTLTGGATITNATLTNLCISDGYQPLGNIEIAETGNGDFGSSGTILLTLPSGFEFNTAAPASSGAGSALVDISVSYAFIGTATLQLTITHSGATGSDILVIEGLEVQAVAGGASGNLERAGGTANLLTTDINYATLSSNVTPAAITFLEDAADPGTPITSYTAEFLPRVTINYTLANPLELFTVAQGVTFSGGATGTIVSDNGVNLMQINLTSGTVTDSETITETGSGFTATTTSAAVGAGKVLLPFTLVADPGANTSNWYFGDVDLTPDLITPSNSNTALGATSAGLYTYNITVDNATCESTPLLFNVMVYDDVHPDNDESTFVNKTFIVSDDRDTVFISNPTGHTVSLTGNGLSVVGGGGDPLLGIFDPLVAGDDGAGGPQSHTITYTITNNTSGESATKSVIFTVEPETSIWTGPPATEYCSDDGVITLEADNSGFNAPSSFTNPYIQYIAVRSTRYAGISVDLDGPTLEAGGYSAPPVAFEYDLDLSLLTVPAGDFESVRFGRVIIDAFGVKRTDAVNHFLVYALPAVSLTNVATAYCEDDGAFTINRSLSYVQAVDDSDPFNPIPTYGGETDQPITNGYELYRWNGATYILLADFTGGTPVNDFDPSDPNQNSTLDPEDLGQFRIVYTTEALTPNSCQGTYSIDVTVSPDTPTPIFNAATEVTGGSVGFVDNIPPAAGVGDNEYLLEYCVGDVVAGFATNDLNTVRWYDDNFNRITAFDGLTTITPAAVGLSLDGGGAFNAEQVVTFYFTSTDATNCESDYRLVTVNTYAIPDVPVVDLTGWPAEVEQGSFYYFEHCIPIGGSVDPANIVFDPLNAGEQYVVEQTLYYDAANSPTTGFIYQFNVGPVGGVHSYGDNVTVPHTTGTATGFVYSLSGSTMILALNTTNLTFNNGAVINNTTSAGTATITGSFEQYALGSNFIDVPVLSSTGNLNYFRYLVSKTENINGGSNFAGCNGSGIYAYSIGWNQPTDVTTADLSDAALSFHVSEGGVLANITHVTTQGMDGYVWYEDNSKTDTIAALINGGTITQDILDDPKVDATKQLLTSAGLVTDRNDDGANDVYTYYLTRIDHENEGINAGFAGCESQTATAVTLTVHAIQPQPTVVSDNTPGALGTPNFTDLNPGPFEDNSVDHFFSICVDQLEADIRFVASEATNAATPREFRWYVSDAGGTRGSLLPTDGTGSATFSELGLSGLNPPSTIDRYFEVIQVTDNDVYEGVESESTFVRVAISPQDALEFRDDVGATIGSDFCRDDAIGNIVVDLYSGGAPAGSGNVDYEIDSYLESTYLASGTPEVDGAVTPGNPTLDLDALHDAVTGSQVIGGEPTVHEITMTYLDPLTLCQGVIIQNITIHPDPAITFFVNGIDIASFATGDDEFCYEDGSIGLQGTLADGTPLTSGTFVSSQLGALTTVNGSAAFNTANEHNSFHGVTGTDGKFLNQSNITITYNYTDANGCDNSVNAVLFVNPEPEVLEVTSLPSSDLAASRTTNFIRMTDFCSGSSAVTAEIKFIDPSDVDPGSIEEDDYSGYTFDWTVNGTAVTDLALDALPNTVEFVPAATSLSISVVVTDLNGCAETFNETHLLQELPSLDITNITNNQSFCFDDAPPTLGLSDATTDGSGSISTINLSNVSSWSVDSYSDDNTNPVQIASGSGSLPTIDLSAWHTDPSLNAPGSNIGGPSTYHTISIVYQDTDRAYQGAVTTCANTTSETIVVHPDPDISIALNGVNADNLQFCYDDINIVIEGIDAVGELALNDGTLEIDGGAISTNGSAVINANTYHGADPFAPQSTHTIVYTYTDGNGCTNSVSRDFLVNPRPEIITGQIQSSTACATGSVELFIELPGSENVADYNFVWSVNGNQEADITGDNTFTTSISGSANLGVVVTNTTSGCVASIASQNIAVGEEPVPSVSWVGITEGRTTSFLITEDNLSLDNANVNFLAVDIDGVQQLSDNSPDLTSPVNFNHTFPSGGTHTIDITMGTTAGCVVSVSRNIQILDHLTGFNGLSPYGESFESDFGGWIVETVSLDGKADDLPSTWIRSNTIPGAGSVDGSFAIFTNNYQPSEVSFVYSPSFDLSGFSSPTISFLRLVQFETFRDGVVFQISTDDGRSWENVGDFDPSFGSSPGWYNEEGITSSPGTVAPGEQATASNNRQIGWADQESGEWLEAKEAVSVLSADASYVRFRFALAAQAGAKSVTGFGFDNVEIYDRDQIVLVEQFSSTLDADAVALGNLLDATPEFAGSDVIRINYFTDLANNGSSKDQLNLRNTVVPGARGALYGVNDVPTVAISGAATSVDPSSSASLSAIGAQLSNAKLDDPEFRVTINASTDVGNNLNVEASFLAVTNEFNNNSAELILNLAVLEPEIVLTEAMGLYNVGDRISNVLRTMLPDAAGQFVSGPVAQGETLTIPLISWPITNMYNPDTLTVVAFIQDVKTKEIYQSAIVGIGGAQDVLGVAEFSSLTIYPNPGNRLITVDFGQVMTEETEWVIFDQTGKEVLQGTIEKGVQQITIETEEVASGLYYYHMVTKDEVDIMERILIRH